MNCLNNCGTKEPFEREPLLRIAAASGSAAIALVALLAAAPMVLAQPGGTSSKASGSYDWVPVMDPSSATVPEPEDGAWLEDEDGLEYTLFRWRKHEGYYHFEADRPGYVKLNHVVRLKFEHEDDEYLYLRWYRTAPIAESLAEDARKAEAEVEAIRASYRTEIEQNDTLRLEAFDEGLPRSQQWRNGFVLADMNGDGHLDLVHGPPRKGSVSHPVIFLGDSAGNWRHWDTAAFPPLPFDYGDIAAGDLDGDGNLDIVLASHLTGLFALRGDGKGGFTNWSEGLPLRRSAVKRQQGIERELARRSTAAAPPPRVPQRPRRRGAGRTKAAEAQKEAVEQPSEQPSEPEPPVGDPAFTSRAIALADWNGNGRLDVLALSEGPTAIQDITDDVAPPLGKVIFLNQGDGTWKSLNGPGQMMGDVILPVDLDGDGQLDFVTSSRNVGAPWLLNYGGAADGSWTAAEIPDMRGRLITNGVAVDDFDGDGRRDLALTFQSQEGGEVRMGLDIYYGQEGEPAWRRASVFATTVHETEGMRALTAGDVDGDGRPDLVALTVEGRVWIFLNDGKGSFVRELSPEAEPDKEHLYCTGYRVVLSDIDRDGKNELVASFAGEPGSEAMFVGALPTRCRALGALRAWKIAPQSAVTQQDRGPEGSQSPSGGPRE
jgi:hypothetical protein